jgi:bifunctional DNA primase/polymerase-like protein
VPPITRDDVDAYLANSVPIVGVHPGAKKPIGEQWEATKGQAERWHEGANVGLFLGDIGGYVDVDLDLPETAALASLYLPEPLAKWGRDSAPETPVHFLYRFPAGSLPKTWLRPKIGVEIRANKLDGSLGLQSVLPPSVHPDGDRYIWMSPKPWENPNFAAVDPVALGSAARQLAIAGAVAALTKDADSVRHDLWLAVCGGLAKAGWNEAAIEKLVTSGAGLYDKDLPDRLAAAASTVKRAKANGAIKGWPFLKKSWGDLVTNQLEAAAKEVAELEGWQHLTVAEGSLVVSGNFAADNDEIVKVLTEVENLFVRGGQLVTVAQRGPCNLGIEVCTEGNITEIATRYGNIQRRTNGGGLQKFTPDARAIRAILERRTWPGLRELQDVVTMPSLRPDGTLLRDVGYDAATRILYKSVANDDAELYSFGESLEDAREGVASLLEPIREMPFVDDASRVAWLAFVVTLAARSAVSGAVPGFASDASAGGTGKTLAVRVASIIATGSDAATQPFPSGDKTEATLFSAGAAGQRLLFFDNVDRKNAESDALEGAMTSGSLAQRKFHAQYTIEAPFRCVVALSGNNMQFSSTTGRRFLFGRQVPAAGIDAASRKFAIPRLVEWTFANRRRLYCAALTILVAHAKAGRPEGAMALGSFEEWSSVIASALEWACGISPVAARASVSAPSSENEFAQELLASLAEWQTKFDRVQDSNGGEWTAAQLWDYCADDLHAFQSVGKQDDTKRRLSRALQATARYGRKVDSARAVGEALRVICDKEYSGMGVLRCRMGRTKTRLWKFEIAGPAPESVLQ